MIDHGVCFSVEPKLRTVIWDFAGDPLPEELLADIRRVAGALHDGPLRTELCALLHADEVEAAASRAARLVRSGRFPNPGPGRPYPWPAV